MATSNKIVYLDNLRIAATLAVVLAHMSEVCLSSFHDPEAAIQPYLMVLINTFARFGTPVFVMITGTLLLQPRRIITYDNVLGKYVWRVLQVLLTIGTAYALLEAVYTHRAFSLGVVLEACRNVLTGNLWDHMWYMYMLMGLYLVMPILKGFVNGADRRNLVLCAMVLGLFVLILPEVYKLSGFRPGISLPVTSIYVLYLFLGYIIAGIGRERNAVVCRLGWILLLTALCTVATGMYLMGPTHDTSRSLSMDILLRFLWANGIFLLFKGTPALDHGLILGQRLGGLVSNTSFGIYLFHPLFMNIMIKVLHVNPLCLDMLSFLLFTAGIIGLSMLATLAFRKLPYIGHIM